MGLEGRFELLSARATMYHPPIPKDLKNEKLKIHATRIRISPTGNNEVTTESTLLPPTHKFSLNKSLRLMSSHPATILIR